MEKEYTKQEKEAKVEEIMQEVSSLMNGKKRSFELIEINSY